MLFCRAKSLPRRPPSKPTSPTSQSFRPSAWPSWSIAPGGKGI
jgi:hypothetical protein